MKQPIIKLALLALVMSLTACSTNTREQNTVVGAGSGAVVGGLIGTVGGGWAVAGGIIAGGLIGGLIGHNMDSSDNSNMYVAMDKNAMNQSSEWKNEKTGDVYTVVPTSEVFTYKGNTHCRHYVAYGKHHGKSTKTKGIACRVNNDVWERMR